MKKSLLLAAVAAFTTQAFSQTVKPDFFTETLRQNARVSTTISLKDSSYTFYGWNDLTNDWDYTSRNVYSYNSFYKENGNLLSEFVGSGWMNFQKAKDYMYDSNHRLLDVSYESWNGSWDNDSRYVYTYDATGNTLTVTGKSWASGAWVNAYYYTYTYSGNKLTSAIYQFWDMGTNSWVNVQKITNTYTGNNLTLSVDENWNSGSWENDKRRTNFVYGGTDLMSYETELWNSTTLAYEIISRESYTYDGAHHTLTSFIQIWNATAGSWENSTRRNYTYDNAGNETVILEQSWDSGSGIWENSYKTFHYYTIGTVGLNEQDKIANALSVYPNPASDRITLSLTEKDGLSKTIITDLTGKTVMTSDISQPGPFNISIQALEPGIYFVELKNEQGSLKGKFIKN